MAVLSADPVSSSCIQAISQLQAPGSHERLVVRREGLRATDRGLDPSLLHAVRGIWEIEASKDQS